MIERRCSCHDYLVSPCPFKTRAQRPTLTPCLWSATCSHGSSAVVSAPEHRVLHKTTVGWTRDEEAEEKKLECGRGGFTSRGTARQSSYTGFTAVSRDGPVRARPFKERDGQAEREGSLTRNLPMQPSRILYMSCTCPVHVLCMYATRPPIPAGLGSRAGHCETGQGPVS